MIFCEGTSGTRQKLFQAACRNHYCPPLAVVPMILFGSAFWNGESKIGEVFKRCAKGGCLFCFTDTYITGRFYETLILSTDSVEEILSHILTNASSKELPRTNLRSSKAALLDWK